MSENLYTKDCIRTHSGKYFNVFEPDPELIVIEDIAHALSNQCRWGGHVDEFYSVAQHSVHTAQIIEGFLPTKYLLQLQALMHDASEAYLMDIPSPIKYRLTNYKEIEDKLMDVIAKKFGIQYPFDPAIKDADARMLQLEWDTLILKKNEPSPIVMCLYPEQAKDLFLQIFYELTANDNALIK